MARKKREPVVVFGEKLHFADGTPVTAELFENEPSEVAVKRFQKIDSAELDELDRILDILLKEPERAAEFANQGGLTYPEDEDEGDDAA